MLVLALEKKMKVKQIVGEHKKGMRAKKYAQKPKAYIEPVKPQGPVSASDAKKKDTKESIAETTPGGMVGKIASVDKAQGTANIQGPDGTTKTVDVSQLKPGENNTVTLNTPELNPGTTVNAEKSMEEGPEVPYYVDTSSGTPMAKTSPRPTQIVPSKLWTAITPDIVAKASAQGFRLVTLSGGPGRTFQGLEGGDPKLGSKIIVSPNDYSSLMGTRTPPGMGVRESEELSRMLMIAGLK